MLQLRHPGWCLHTAICKDKFAAAASGLRLGLFPLAFRSVLYLLMSVCKRRDL